MKYTIQNGSAHFYICAVNGGYLAKSIGDSEDALRVTKGLVAKLNQFEKMKEALEAVCSALGGRVHSQPALSALEQARAAIVEKGEA